MARGLHFNMKGSNAKPLSGAQWIASSRECAAPVYSRCFMLGEIPENATLYVTGLGYFEACLNGVKLSDDRFIPPASDYLRRDFRSTFYPVKDTFTHRIYYHVYPIRDLLHVGENRLEIQCGGGWFVQNERLAEGKMAYSDRTQCIFAMELGTDVLTSDGSETWRESEIRESLLFLGETIDRNFHDSDEKSVIILPAPDAVLTEAAGVPDRIIRTIKPELLSVCDGVYIYDAGENISGLASLTTHAPKGEEYLLRFSEVLDASGKPDFTSTGASYIGASGRQQIMCDRFITDGNVSTFVPKFVWHGFRYIALTGNLEAVDDLTVYVIHADVPLTCEFDSDSEGLNFLFDAYVRTQLSNYHGSFPSDCPHRERLGYTGDGQICAQTAMLMFDAAALYKKWIQDILDSQDIETGHVQHTAPFGGGGGGPGGWCSAIVTVPYAYYRQYGDRSVVRDTIDAMKRFITFTATCMENGLVVREAEGGWCLGDWCMLESGKIPNAYVNTCWFIHALRLYREMLRDVCGRRDPEAEQLEEICLAAVTRQYETIRHIGAANMYAAWIGIDSVDACADYYDQLSSFDTGFLGTDILCKVLFDAGRGDIAYQLLSSEKPGSYLYMKRNGATTIWERWMKDGSSKSHPMFGACCRQLFEGFLGIQQRDGFHGFERVIIRPYLPKELNFIRGAVTTPKGRISVSLERGDSGAVATICIPAGIHAVFQTDTGEVALKCGETRLTLDM